MSLLDIAPLGLGLISFSTVNRAIAGSVETFSHYLTIKEDHEDELTITKHPVERGASVSDHAYKEPSSLVLELGWSNSGSSGLISTAQSLLSGNGLGRNYVEGVYKSLLTLQARREPFTVTTGKRVYKNMMFRSLGTTTDAETENSLIVRATLQEIIIVQTQVAAVPPKAVQANPQSSAATQNLGTKQLQPAPNVNQSALSKIFGGP